MSSGEAPPTAAMAAQSGPLVLLKAAGNGPPIFLAHGLGGNSMTLFQLATHMRASHRSSSHPISSHPISSHPIYGMQSRGLDGLHEPLDRIEDMADFHLDAITQVQPHGPYCLVGYSLGGLVTLEIARRFSKRSEKIALLAMLDSYPDRRYLSFAQHARLIVRLAKQRATALIRGGEPERNDRNPREQPQLNESAVQVLRHVTECQQRALSNYRPQFYDGKIKFVRAASSSFLPDNPVAVWSRWARQFEAETVACDHTGLLTTHVEDLASTLSRYVSEAFGEMENGSTVGAASR